MIRLRRPSPVPILLLLAGSLSFAPLSGGAAPRIIATQQAPSSVTARYGPVVKFADTAPGGVYLAPTRTGIEFRRSFATSDTLLRSFRTAGIVREVATSATHAYAIAGERGIISIDLFFSTLPAIESHDHLGDLKHGAFAPSGGVLAAATEDAVFFLRQTLAGPLDLIGTRAYQDGRRVLRIAARSDSFLVLAVRTVPTLRMFLTLYRARSGSPPESLWEFQANGLQAQDVSWPDAMAFVAVGSSGVLPIDTETRLAGAPVPLPSGRFVRDLDADGANVVAVGEARAYAQFARGGPKGGTLGPGLERVTSIEPLYVTLVGGLAVVSEEDQILPVEPDEVALSILEVLDVAQPATPSRTTTTGTGRVRRVVVDQGLAYVADYTGGLRIYRAAPGDTALVGSLPLPGNAFTYDLSLDRVRHLVFLASGSGGLAVADVTDPAAPAFLGAMALPGFTTAVTVIDTTLVAVGRRGGSSAGVTFVDVNVPPAPLPRGSLEYPFILDPRSLAARDTVLFVADDLLGLLSISFKNPDLVAQVGTPTGGAARDLDILGTRLLVGTSNGGVQVVDVSDPSLPTLLTTLPTPPVYGVAQQGQTGLAMLGDEGTLAIDLRVPSLPAVRGLISVPGFSRDAAWVGDTLLVAESFGLERFLASPTVTTDPALSLSVDPDAVLPTVTIVWFASLPPGAVGWNVYRDTGPAQAGMTGPSVRINQSLLGPSVHALVDATAEAAATYRYRLEAFFPDGASRKEAEGTITLRSNSALGRVFPNPYRPRNGESLRIPYRVLSIDGGKSIELRVYDPSGRLVREIVATTPSGGGFGSMTWDGRDDRGRLLADGVYFIKVTGPGIDDGRQFILLR